MERAKTRAVRRLKTALRGRGAGAGEALVDIREHLTTAKSYRCEDAQRLYTLKMKMASEAQAATTVRATSASTTTERSKTGTLPPPPSISCDCREPSQRREEQEAVTEKARTR
jgi:hypothetical protein